MLVAREREAGVDDDDARSPMLEHGHVLADLAEAAERDDAEDPVHQAQCTRASRRVAAGSSRPSRSRQPRTASRSSSVASTSGSRWPPTSCPSRFSAALIAIGFGATRRSSIDGRSSSSSSRARADVARRRSAGPAPSPAGRRRGCARRRRRRRRARGRAGQVVVARVEVEPELDDAPGLLEVVVRLLHRADVRDLAPARRSSPARCVITTRLGML